MLQSAENRTELPSRLAAVDIREEAKVVQNGILESFGSEDHKKYEL